MTVSIHALPRDAQDRTQGSRSRIWKENNMVSVRHHWLGYYR